MQTRGPTRPHRLQSGSGNACAGDPPDHPRYYTRAVYTPSGNSFNYPDAPQYWLDGKWFTELEDVDKFFKPLPLDHPRTRAWIGDTYRHFRHCYQDAERLEYGRPGCLIYPLPSYELTRVEIDASLDDPDDARFSDAHREKCRKARAEAVDRETQRAARIATPENHMAVVLIRRYYPEYQPELDLIRDPGEGSGHWWETLPERPTPEKCPGEPRWSPARPHPVNSSWCQVCGWHSDK